MSAIGFAVLPSLALAQFPEPRLDSIFPAGGQAGSTFEVELTGPELEGLGGQGLWFSHQGIRAFKLKDRSFVVAIATGVPNGSHEVRVRGSLGISNPRAFVVGTRPESNEKEPNNTAQEANAIALGSTVNGRISSELDLDCFAFEGKKGARVLVVVEGFGIDSRIDPSAELVDPEGKRIGVSGNARASEPMMDVVLPADGRYVVKLRDMVYGGSSQHFYRLSVHEGPWVDSVFPPVAMSGKPVELTLIGRNLGGGLVPELAIRGAKLERKVVSIVAPTLSELPANASGFLPHFAAGRMGFEYRYTTPQGESNPAFIALSDEEVVAEVEPNDDPRKPQSVSPPCTIAGRFGSVGDVDTFRFTAKKGEVWWIEAAAERNGSEADPSFVVQRVPDKGELQELLEAEDWPDPGGAIRFPAPSVDAVARFEVPEDGVYQVQARDLYSSQRGDAKLTYTLQIRRPKPDFRLVVMPVTEGPDLAPRGVTLRAGGRARAWVLASRLDGFNDAIRVEAKDAPPGVQIEPTTILPSETRALLVISAEASAQGIVGPVKLVGRGRWRDRKEVLQYADGVAGGIEVDQAAAPATVVWPAPNDQFNLLRVARSFAVAVVEPTAIRLTADPQHSTIGQGRFLPIAVKLSHAAGFANEVNLNISGLPPGTADVQAKFTKESDSVVLPLYVPLSTPPGRYSLIVNGSTVYPYSKDPNAKDKPNVAINEPSNPVAIDVVQSPVSMSVNPQAFNLAQGGRAEVVVSIVRINGFQGPVEVELTAPGIYGLSSNRATIPIDQTSAKIMVQASPESPPGATSLTGVRATSIPKFSPIETDAPMSIAIQKK